MVVCCGEETIEEGRSECSLYEVAAGRGDLQGSSADTTLAGSWSDGPSWVVGGVCGEEKEEAKRLDRLWLVDGWARQGWDGGKKVERGERVKRVGRIEIIETITAINKLWTGGEK